MRLLSIVFIFLSFACHEARKRGKISDIPINLFEINSDFDDYNSDIKVHLDGVSLFFSSNRNTSGRNFDVIHYPLNITSSFKTGNVTVSEYNNNSGSYDKIGDALYKMRTASDELGPYVRNEGLKPNATYGYETYLFLFSTNDGGNQDIKFVHNFDDESYSIPQSVSFLNSSQDDAYPCITADSSALYFCSNRTGKFKIFKAGINKNVSVFQNLQDTSPKDIVEVSSLSSDADDKCPLIVGDVMVFASNRAGGFGGFDLYYSLLKDGEWSTPVSFGDKINTEFDEYRPFINQMSSEFFDNDFMIFSSNRPGGKGGFDLYYVGVPKDFH